MTQAELLKQIERIGYAAERDHVAVQWCLVRTLITNLVRIESELNQRIRVAQAAGTMGPVSYPLGAE